MAAGQRRLARRAARIWQELPAKKKEEQR